MSSMQTAARRLRVVYSSGKVGIHSVIATSNSAMDRFRKLQSLDPRKVAGVVCWLDINGEPEFGCQPKWLVGPQMHVRCLLPVQPAPAISYQPVATVC